MRSLVLPVSNPYESSSRAPRDSGCYFNFLPTNYTFFQRIIAGDEIQVWGRGLVKCTGLSVLSLTWCHFMVQSINKDLSGIYNVGSGEGATLGGVVLSII